MKTFLIIKSFLKLKYFVKIKIFIMIYFLEYFIVNLVNIIFYYFNNRYIKIRILSGKSKVYKILI